MSGRFYAKLNAAAPLTKITSDPIRAAGIFRILYGVSGILKSLAYCQLGWKSLILPRGRGHAIRGPFLYWVPSYGGA
jgi:hypothetical protein